MADYGVISDVSISLVTLLDQDLNQPPLNARAVLDDLSDAAPGWAHPHRHAVRDPGGRARPGTARGRSSRPGRP